MSVAMTLSLAPSAAPRVQHRRPRAEALTAAACQHDPVEGGHETAADIAAGFDDAQLCVASLDSTILLRGQKTVQILHNGSIYTLQATKLGKLILTK